MSEQHQLFERIRSLAKFADESPDPVLRVHHTGRLMYANKPAELILAHWGIAIGEQVPASAKAALGATEGDGQAHSFDVECPDHVFRLTMTPVADAKYLNIYGRDISDSADIDNLKHQLRGALGELSSLCSELTADNAAELIEKIKQASAQASKLLAE